jgi:curved DNA-binding protein CbpA
MTHYELLGVPEGATHAEIKRAYHGLARRHHPDAHSGEAPAVVDEARRRMAAINAAWAVLGDPARRRAYDAGAGRDTAPAAAGPDEPEPDLDAGYPGWFEPDQVPAADLDEDPSDDRPRGPADLVVLVPVGLVAAAVALFAFSMLSQSSGAFALALVLVPVALLSFLAMPLVVLLRGTRERSRSS